MPSPSQKPVYGSGQWEVDLGRRELRLRGIEVAIGGRAFEIIEVLVQSAGQLVTKDDLIARVWPGASVEDNTLQVHISAVRKAFGRRSRNDQNRFRARLSPARELDDPIRGHAV